MPTIDAQIINKNGCDAMKARIPKTEKANIASPDAKPSISSSIGIAFEINQMVTIVPRTPNQAGNS